MNGFQWGLSKVDQSFMMDLLGQSKFKATLLSVRGQIWLVTGATLGFLLGTVIDWVGYREGFLWYAVAFLILLVPMYVYIHVRHRDVNEKLLSVK